MEFTEYMCERTGLSYYSNEKFTPECRNIVLLGYTKDKPPKQILKCTIHSFQGGEAENKGIILKPLVPLPPPPSPLPSPVLPEPVPVPSAPLPPLQPAEIPSLQLPKTPSPESPPPVPSVPPPAQTLPLQQPKTSSLDIPTPSLVLVPVPVPLVQSVPPAPPVRPPTPAQAPRLHLPKAPSLDGLTQVRAPTPAPAPVQTPPLQLPKLTVSPSSIPGKKQVLIINGKRVHLQLLDPTDRPKVSKLENGQIFNKATEDSIKSGIKLSLKKNSSTCTDPIKTAEKPVQVTPRSVSVCIQTDPVKILPVDSICETVDSAFDIVEDRVGEIVVDDFFNEIFKNDTRDMGTMLNSNMRDSARSTAAKEKFFVDFKSCLEFNVKGNLPIHDAVLLDDSDRIRRQCVVLKARQEDINIPNNDGYTPLQLAVLNETSEENIVQLLKYKSDIGVKDSEGNNVLHLAVENNRERALTVLLEEANRVDFDIDSFNFEGFTPLMLCAMTKKVQLAKILLEHKAKVNARDLKSGRTPLFHAAENFDLTMVQVLLSYEADTKLRNYFGTSPHDAMYEIEEMPVDIKTMILGRDLHARASLKRKPPAGKTYTGAHKASKKAVDRSGSGSDSNTSDYPETSNAYLATTVPVPVPLKTVTEVKVERDPTLRVYGGVKKEQNGPEDGCRDSKVVVRKFCLNMSKLKEERNKMVDEMGRTYSVREGDSLLKKGAGKNPTGASASISAGGVTNHPSGSTIKKLNIIPTYQKITNPRYRVYDKKHLNFLN